VGHQAAGTVHVTTFTAELVTALINVTKLLLMLLL
jgi:hypothetical protein